MSSTTIYIMCEGECWSEDYDYDAETNLITYDNGIYDSIAEEWLCTMDVTPEEMELLETGRIEPKDLPNWGERLHHFEFNPKADY